MELHSYFTRPPILLHVDAPGKVHFFGQLGEISPRVFSLETVCKMSGSLGVK